MSARSLLLGGLAGILSTLLGLSVARAECDQDTRFGDLHARCELRWALAEYACDDAAQSWIEDDQLTEEQVGGWSGMYEACMRLTVPLECTGLPAAQHYDTSDGAFWR